MFELFQQLVRVRGASELLHDLSGQLTVGGRKMLVGYVVGQLFPGVEEHLFVDESAYLLFGEGVVDKLYAFYDSGLVGWLHSLEFYVLLDRRIVIMHCVI